MNWLMVMVELVRFNWLGIEFLALVILALVRCLLVDRVQARLFDDFAFCNV